MSLIKFIFSSLFKNETVIEESKKRPWWLAIVLLVVSCVLAVVPCIVNVLGQNGSDIITATENYNIDYSLKTFTYEYLRQDSETEAKVRISITDGVLTCSSQEVMPVMHGEDVTLLVQYVPDTTKLDETVNELKTYIPTETATTPIKSMLLLGNDSVYLYLFASDANCTFLMENGQKVIQSSSDPVTSVSGNYKKVQDSVANFNAYYDSTLSASAAYEAALTKWKTFFDQAYAAPRNTLALTYSLMFSGLNLLIVLIMSLTIFLLSRSKNSIRKYSYLTALKMSCFASLSPAILALIFGFMIPAMQSVSFVLLFGLRATWMGMKATSPGEAAAVRK